jgi:hypothetical protein
MMTKSQLRKALLKVPNVVEFCAKHELPRRTVMRLRDKADQTEPRRGTIQLVETALRAEGIVSGDQQTNQRTPGRKRS